MTTPAPADPFDTLGLEPRFDLRRDQIERAYLARAAGVHPDLAASDDAERTSAALNEARDTLADPERRAEALLARLGGPSKSEGKDLPPGFLMEMMQLREQIEEELSDEADPEALDRWEAWADERRAQSLDRIAGLFRDASDGDTTRACAHIRIELNQLRYIERLIEQLDPEYDPARADFDR